MHHILRHVMTQLRYCFYYLLRLNFRCHNYLVWNLLGYHGSCHINYSLAADEENMYLFLHPILSYISTQLLHLDSTLLCTINDNQLFLFPFFSYVLIWFSIVHHYSCQCQILFEFYKYRGQKQLSKDDYTKDHAKSLILQFLKISHH
jgi:hypothetical protein